jgi:uncharacterized protein YrrD
LRTLSLLKGLPVYAKDTGDKLGEVFDLCLSNVGRVEGVIVRNGTIFKKSSLIHFEDVSSFGSDGIMVENASIIQPAHDDVTHISEGKERLVGKPLLSSEGEHLGLLEDVYFHEEMGIIVGYECSDGFFADITEGKRVIKTEDPPKIGKDAIVVNIKQ